MKIGMIGKPRPGESVSGDAHYIGQLDGATLICLIDALGHGEAAYSVAQKLVQYLQQNHVRDLEELIQGGHQELRGTRGAVAGMVLIREEGDRMTFAGVGNITAVLVNTSSNGSPMRANHLVSVGGVLGYNLRKVVQFDYPFEKSDALVMFTDGVASHFDALPYISPGCDAQQVAELILEDHCKGNDDSLVIVVSR